MHCRDDQSYVYDAFLYLRLHTEQVGMGRPQNWYRDGLVVQQIGKALHVRVIEK